MIKRILFILLLAFKLLPGLQGDSKLYAQAGEEGQDDPAYYLTQLDCWMDPPVPDNSAEWATIWDVVEQVNEQNDQDRADWINDMNQWVTDTLADEDQVWQDFYDNTQGQGTYQDWLDYLEWLQQQQQQPPNPNSAPNYYAAISDGDRDPGTGSALVGNLPCNNSFLMPYKKIIHFTPEQLAKIKEVHFDGGALDYFKDINNHIFYNAIRVIVSNNEIQSKETTYMFVAFDHIMENLSLLPQVKVYNADDNGVTRTVIQNYPVNDLEYVFVINSPTNVEEPVAGKTVETINSDNQLYCKTLTPEDCARGLTSGRDAPYLTPLHMQHPSNLPDWCRKFIDKLLNGLVTQCAVSYINAKLDALHASSLYTNESDQVKEQIEYLAVGYYYIFGSLSCLTDEDHAKTASEGGKFAMGMLHELINTVDVVALAGSIVDLAKGLGNLVVTDVKQYLDAIKQACIDEVTTGTIDYEDIFKKFLTSNVNNLLGYWDDAKTIANQFEYFYFTGCDNYAFSDGSHGDICPYRHGQIFLMVLPIIISGGDWAVMKADKLIATGLEGAGYFAETKEAVRLLRETELAGATVTESGNVTTITEAADNAAMETNDAVVTDITKDNATNTVKFERDGNAFEPYPTNTPNVQLVNGRKPVNSQFAGKTYHTKSGYDVSFNQYGFPDMTPFSARTVRITGMEGEYTNDFAKANQAAFGVSDPNYHLTVNNGQYSQYTWHHNEDTQSMMLVPKNINNPAAGGVAHTGGAAVVLHNRTNTPPLSFPSPPLK